MTAALRAPSTPASTTRGGAGRLRQTYYLREEQIIWLLALQLRLLQTRRQKWTSSQLVQAAVAVCQADESAFLRMLDQVGKIKPKYGRHRTQSKATRPPQGQTTAR